MNYLNPNPTIHPDYAPTYSIEEGVNIDPQDSPRRTDTREYHQAEYALIPQTRTEQLAEEARWAARSGPVFIIQTRKEVAA